MRIVMKKVFFILFIVFFIINCANSQNIISNSGFEGDYPTNVDVGAYPYGAYMFKYYIEHWEGRLPKMNHKYSQAWHSPDWACYGNCNGGKYVAIRGYELVQQELMSELISDGYYLLRFKYRWHTYSDKISLQFYLSENKMKYKKEKLYMFQNEENHLCSENYKEFKGVKDEDYFIIHDVGDLHNLSDIVGEMYYYEQIIKIPANTNLKWFGFQTVLKPEFYDLNCMLGYLDIDDIEFELVSCSADPCSPTNGSVDVQSFTHPQYGHCFSNFNNISKISNFRVSANILGQSSIYTKPDIECVNGIKDTICWNGRNNNNAPVAPAWYYILFDATNDCGTYSQRYQIVHPQGSNFIKKTPYLCNSSVQTPVECCGHEPNIYIYDEVFTGAGYIDLIAMNSIIAEDIVIESSVDRVYFQAGEEIEITDAIIDGKFIAEIMPCEPFYSYYLNNNTDSPNWLDYDIYITNDSLKEVNEDFYQTLDFIIYPNPTKDILYVTSDYEKNFSFFIYDFSGKLQVKGDGISPYSIDVSELKSGLYLISINAEGSYFNLKFIKK